MATTLYKGKARVVKVSIGSSTGHRVARIIRDGGLIPEGVEQEQLDSLVARGLIEQITILSPEEIAEAEAKAEAERERLAEAAAERTRKAAEAKQAKADADAAAKSAATTQPAK